MSCFAAVTEARIKTRVALESADKRREFSWD